jgi:hypothetical protein
MSVAKDIAEYLETNGIGTYATDIFIGSEPPEPDSCITIYEYPGSPPDLQAEMENPNIQIRVRNASWEAARLKAQAIQDLLQEIGNEYNTAKAEGITINGTFYAAIRTTLSGITSLGEDENRRMRLTQNYSIMKGRN